MKIKTYILKAFAVVLLAGAFTYSSNAQTCDSLANVCRTMLKKPSKGETSSIFVSDGQTYRAFLDEEQSAEFQTTFYGGNTYRIAASAGTKDKYIIFEVWDSHNNMIFSNVDHQNAPYWDFKVEQSLDVIITMRLDSNKKTSGCGVMLIGFKQKK